MSQSLQNTRSGNWSFDISRYLLSKSVGRRHAAFELPFSLPGSVSSGGATAGRRVSQPGRACHHHENGVGPAASRAGGVTGPRGHQAGRHTPARSRRPRSGQGRLRLIGRRYIPVGRLRCPRPCGAVRSSCAGPQAIATPKAPAVTAESGPRGTVSETRTPPEISVDHRRRSAW